MDFLIYNSFLTLIFITFVFISISYFLYKILSYLYKLFIYFKNKINKLNSNILEKLERNENNKDYIIKYTELEIDYTKQNLVIIIGFFTINYYISKILKISNADYVNTINSLMIAEFYFLFFIFVIKSFNYIYLYKKLKSILKTEIINKTKNIKLKIEKEENIKEHSNNKSAKFLKTIDESKEKGFKEASQVFDICKKNKDK